MNSVILQTEDPFGGGTGASMFGYLGVTFSMIFSCLGAAYGTARAGAGLASMGVLHPTVVMRCMIPVVMAGVLGIYGLIISVILMQGIKDVTDSYDAYTAYAQMAAGLSVGLSSLGMIHNIIYIIIYIIYIAYSHNNIHINHTSIISIAGGYAIGIIGDYGVRAVAKQPGIYVGMILMLIFSEALALYGLIVAIVLSQK